MSLVAYNKKMAWGVRDQNCKGISSVKPPTMKNKWQKETHEAPGDLPLSMKLLKVVSFWIILIYFDSLIYSRFFGRCTLLQLQVQWSNTGHLCVWLSVIPVAPPGLDQEACVHRQHKFTTSFPTGRAKDLSHATGVKSRSCCEERETKRDPILSFWRLPE